MDYPRRSSIVLGVDQIQVRKDVSSKAYLHAKLVWQIVGACVEDYARAER